MSGASVRTKCAVAAAKALVDHFPRFVEQQAVQLHGGMG